MLGQFHEGYVGQREIAFHPCSPDRGPHRARVVVSRRLRHRVVHRVPAAAVCAVNMVEQRSKPDAKRFADRRPLRIERFGQLTRMNGVSGSIETDRFAGGLRPVEVSDIEQRHRRVYQQVKIFEVGLDDIAPKVRGRQDEREELLRVRCAIRGKRRDWYFAPRGIRSDLGAGPPRGDVRCGSFDHGHAGLVGRSQCRRQSQSRPVSVTVDVQYLAVFEVRDEVGRPFLELYRLDIQNHEIGARDRLCGIAGQYSRGAEPVASRQRPVRGRRNRKAARCSDGLRKFALIVPQRETHVVSGECQIARHRRADVPHGISDYRDSRRHAASANRIEIRLSEDSACVDSRSQRRPVGL